MHKEPLVGIGRVYRRTRRDPKAKAKDSKKRIRSDIWWVQYYHRGRQIRKSTGTTSRSKAVKFLKGEIEKSMSGTLTVGQAERLTFQDLVNGLERDYRRNGRRSLDRAQDAVDHLRSYFGQSRAIEIVTSSIDQYVDYRMDIDGAAAGTVAYEVAIFRRMFNLAENVLGKVPKFPSIKNQNVRKGFFEEHEFAAFLPHFEKPLQPLLTFAYLTGWRIQSEIFPLTWTQVDFTAGEVRLEPGTTKSDEGRTFPIGMFPELEELLKGQRAYTDQVQRDTNRIVKWVFHRAGEPVRSIRGAWKAALEESKIGKKIPHDFRRTAVRRLERAGVPRSVAMRLVGHKTEEIYRRYAIVGKNDLVDGVKRLADYHREMQNQAKVVPITRQETK